MLGGVGIAKSGWVDNITLLQKVDFKLNKLDNVLENYLQPNKCFLLRARRVKLLVTVHKANAELCQLYLSVSVCLCVNNAARCTLYKLSAIDHVPPHRYICIYQFILWRGHYCAART